MIQIKEKINILGTYIHSITRAEATTFIVEALQEKRKASVFTPNPELIMEAYDNETFRDVLNKGDLVVADGIGVVIGSKIISNPLPERVAGYDMIQDVFKQIAETKLSVYFLGAGKGVTEIAKEKMEYTYKGLKIVGVHHGYFDDDDKMIEIINKANPDLLLVGLGAPRQETFITEHREQLCASVMVGVGGSFDGMAGKVKRAPDLFIKLGLEWFYRLLLQPSRIGRMMKLPLFLFKVIIEGRKYQ